MSNNLSEAGYGDVRNSIKANQGMERFSIYKHLQYRQCGDGYIENGHYQKK